VPDILDEDRQVAIAQAYGRKIAEQYGRVAEFEELMAAADIELERGMEKVRVFEEAVRKLLEAGIV
jgi:hypothetical protein